MGTTYHHKSCVAASDRGLHTSGYVWMLARCTIDIDVGLAEIQSVQLCIALLAGGMCELAPMYCCVYGLNG